MPSVSAAFVPRILAVVADAAGRRRGRVPNPPFWIRRARRGGWSGSSRQGREQPIEYSPGAAAPSSETRRQRAFHAEGDFAVMVHAASSIVAPASTMLTSSPVANASATCAAISTAKILDLLMQLSFQVESLKPRKGP